jgi:hypothetical protein
MPGETPATSPHAWPVSAAAESAPALRDFVAALSTGRLTEKAVQSLKQILAQPVAPRRDLVQVGLNRRVRLAIVSVPQWTREVNGRHLMCISLLSLRW